MEVEWQDCCAKLEAKHSWHNVEKVFINIMPKKSFLGNKTYKEKPFHRNGILVLLGKKSIRNYNYNFLLYLQSVRICLGWRITLGNSWREIWKLDKWLSVTARFYQTEMFEVILEQYRFFTNLGLVAVSQDLERYKLISFSLWNIWMF